MLFAAWTSLSSFLLHTGHSYILSFSSNDISNGNLYKKLEFNSNNQISQIYWYIYLYNLNRYHRSSFTKSSIVKKGIKDAIGDWTEKEAMENTNYIRIYDSGLTKWELNILP